MEVDRTQLSGCELAAFQWVDQLARADRQRLVMTDPSEVRSIKYSLSGILRGGIRALQLEFANEVLHQRLLWDTVR